MNVLLRRPCLLAGAALLGSARAASALTPLTSSSIPGLVGGTKGRPAVIVIQEWWGITDQIKEHAEKIADQGYRVLVPDIYKGKVGVDKEEASHLMSNLDFLQAVREISEAATYLKEEGSPRVGVVGYCMGGALTMGALAAAKDLTCGAPFYGVNFGLFDAASQLSTKPVQGHFGKEDTMEGFADEATANKLRDELKATGNPHVDVFVYPGVGHAFMNDSPAPYASFEKRQAELGFPPYDPAQAELAWKRLFQFFATHLKEDKSEL